MAYEKAGVELELSKAEAYISSAKQAAAATDLLYSSISKMGGVNISSLNAFSSTMKDLVKVGQDAGKSAQQAATQIVEVGTKAGASSSHFGDLIGKVKDVTGGFLSLGGSAVGTLVKGLGDIGSMGVTAAKALLDVGGAAAGAAWSGISKLGSMAVDAGKFLVELGVKAAEAGAKFAISFGKDAVKAAMDFDKQMSEVAAVANATPAQLAKMSDEALRLGAVFPVSATDAAKAMTELGKAGFNTDQILAASVGTVQLASATHYSMADSATVLANAINQFGLKASDASRVTDLFAAAANSSAVDVKDLAKTFEYVGPVAQAAGFSIEDVAKATAVMGNAGIKGSSAGTGLKAVLSSLIAPSDKAAAAFETLGFKSTDANGKIRPLQDQLVDLRSKFKGLSSQEQVDLATKIVGVNHFSKLLAVMNATDDSFNQVSDSINKANGAGARMAATMNDNLAGAVENLKGSFETLQIKAGKALEPLLKDLANLGSLIINKLTPYVDTFAKKFQDGYKKVLVVSKEVLANWNLFKASFTSGFEVPPAWTGMAATMARLGEALSPLKQAFSDLVTAIMPAPVDKLAAGLDKAGTAAANAHPVIDAIGWTVKNVLVPGIEGAAKTIDNLQLAFSKIQTAITPLLPGFGDFAKKAWDIYQAVSPLNTALDVFNGFMTGGLGGGIDALGQHVTDLGNVFGVDLSGPVATVTDFLKNDLVPGIEGVIKTVGDVLPGIIAFGQGFLDKVLPPIQSFVGWVVDNVGPVVKSAFDTFQTDVLPALQRFVSFIGDAVLPKVGDLVNFVSDKVGPILKEGFDILSTTVIPTLGKLVAVVMDDVIPVLTSWWSIIATVLEPAFNALVWVVENVVLPAVKAIWGFINDPLIPIFKTIAAIIKDPVMTTFQSLADFFQGAVKAAIGVVVDVWNGLIDTIKKGVDIVAAVAAGDWGKAWDLITGKAQQGADDAKKSLDKLNTDISNQDYSAAASKAGATIVTGMAAGIRNISGQVAAAAAQVAQNAIDAAKQRLRSESPSKVFIGIGEDVGLGFSQGIEGSSGLVRDSMENLTLVMNKVVEDNTQLFKWNINQYLSPVSDMVQNLDETNPVINLSLKEMLKSFSQTVLDQAGGFKGALDGFISPVAGLKDHLGSVIGQVVDAVDTGLGGFNQTVKDHGNMLITDMKVLPDTVEKTGTDITAVGNSPADAMTAVLAAVAAAVDSQAALIVQKLNDLLGQIQSILAGIASGVAAIGQVNVPGGNHTGPEQHPGQGTPTAPGGNPGGGGGIFLPSPATAQQISNMYSSTSTTNHGSTTTVVNNYSMPLNVAPMQIGAIQQGYAHARAMIPA